MFGADELLKDIKDVKNCLVKYRYVLQKAYDLGIISADDRDTLWHETDLRRIKVILSEIETMLLHH